MAKNEIFYHEKPVHFTDQGKGNVVVLLHGFLESLEIWNDFALILSQEFRVIRIDLPGHGETPVFDEVHTMDMMADMVKVILDELEVVQCTVIGHSMGGYVALALARQYPHVVRGLGLFHSHAAADSEEARENRRRTINIVKLNHAGFISQFIPELFAQQHVQQFQEEIEKLRQMAAKTTTQAVIAALEGMKMRQGHLDLLIETDIPVLFIAGKEDQRMPYQHIMAQAMLPRHAEILLLADAGHMGFIEAPAKTLIMIRGYLNQVFTNG